MNWKHYSVGFVQLSLRVFTNPACLTYHWQFSEAYNTFWIDVPAYRQINRWAAYSLVLVEFHGGIHSCKRLILMTWFVVSELKYLNI